jgi:hypothetical protein
MEQRKQKPALVLKYGKRRYDGGPEVEAIRAIERQQAVAQMSHLQNRQRHLEPVQIQVESAPEPVTLPQPAPVAQAAPATGSRKNRILEALLLGPMELCIGAVGIMTATLAIITFRRLNNAELLEQSRAVFRDCVKTFRKGLLDTLTTPVRALKAAKA